MIFLDRPQNALVANAAATSAATNLVGASLSAPANFFKVGQVWRLQMWFTYLHTAAATPTLTFELAVAGTAVVALVVTPVATASTYHGCAECVFTVRTVGAGGTLMGAIQVDAPLLTTPVVPAQVDTTADTIDTTIARLVEFRCRMTTAVASNTLTLAQGYCERLCG